MEILEPPSQKDYVKTPQPVQVYILHLEGLLASHQVRINELEAVVEKLNEKNGKNSTNSSKPPSSDSPYKEKKETEAPAKFPKKKDSLPKGGQPGHKGHQQELLPPTETHDIFPTQCSCGCRNFEGVHFETFYTHQNIELPPPRLDIRHFILNKCNCPSCGQSVKATVPENTPEVSAASLICMLTGGTKV
ncbi:DUF6444 domain-containing protein [Desulfoluna sp.]|uniref:DUF6444 domain-containing protein n=1 Tax=Desulfoluna sp. TaxID=2045199 RepID=UPI00261428F8|nr:DUF6444 domain-containing protein [Desulfoluna sp.]